MKKKKKVVLGRTGFINREGKKKCLPLGDLWPSYLLLTHSDTYQLCNLGEIILPLNLDFFHFKIAIIPHRVMVGIKCGNLLNKMFEFPLHEVENECMLSRHSHV